MSIHQSCYIFPCLMELLWCDETMCESNIILNNNDDIWTDDATYILPQYSWSYYYGNVDENDESDAPTPSSSTI